ncbi:MAG: GNAT family N-acetyltransferase [Acidimicrobiales bacterium]
MIVTNNPAATRFELHHDDELVGFADYHLRDGATVVSHVETFTRYRGRGYAAVLMAGLLDHLRRDGGTIVPVCSYAVSYLRDNPDQHDLLA